MVQMISFPSPSTAPHPSSPVKTWRIMIKDLHLDAFLGVHEQEKQRRQPVLINIECDLQMPVPEDKPSTKHVYCYNRLVESITKLISEQHIHLVETLAEQISDLCLGDERVQKVMVRVEKTRIYSNAASAGVEIVRHQTPLRSTSSIG